MANSFVCSALFLCLFLHSICFQIHASSSSSSSSLISSNELCDSAPHPDFCRSLEPQNISTNINDFGRLSFQKSLSASTSLLDSINGYLNSSSSSNTLTPALQDCQHLLSSNVDLLSNVAKTLEHKDALQSSEFEDVETRLSAVLSNKMTCLDGLISADSSSSSDIVKELSSSLTNGTMLCSISLALFKNDWTFPPSEKSRSLVGNFPYLSSTHRKLLRISAGAVAVTNTVVVNPNGRGNYTTISAAIAAAPSNRKAGQGYHKIHVVAGVYQEYITIPASTTYLMIVGDGIGKTIITGNRYNGGGKTTTFSSATFAVEGQGFVGLDFTIRNTAGAAKGQAVALRNSADQSAFYKCSFEGYQDTLLSDTNRQFYRECDIYGTVDYIFGFAAAVFQQCNIYSRLPSQGQFNTITAQGKCDKNQKSGIVIHNCKIKAAGNLGLTQTYLGRPWKEFSTTVVMESFIDSLINPAGWSPTADRWLNTLYFTEYNNKGPGSDTTNRIKWKGYHIITNGADVKRFTVSEFITGNGWLPCTGVPFTGGLLSP